MKRLLAAMAFGLLLTGCLKKDAPVGKSAPEPAKTEVTADLVLDAALRQNRATKICYESKNNWLFAYFPMHEDIEGENDPWQGWVLIDTWEVREISNGTFIFIDSTSGHKGYNPDITGLTCKTQKLNSQHFKYNDTSEHAR
jgi:hypothetical protein